MTTGRRVGRLVLPAIVLVALVATVTCRHHHRPPRSPAFAAASEAPSSAAPASLEPLPPAPVTGRFALGINEAVSVPAALLARGLFDGDRLDAALADDAKRAREEGAVAVRGHTGGFPGVSMQDLRDHPEDLARADAWVRAVLAAGLEPVGMLSPWPGNRTAVYTDSYVPPDMAEYRRYVRTLVERYDHDGIDDMPGLTAAVRWWEVDNEPDLKLTDRPRGAGPDVPRGPFCTPQEYAQVLVASAEEIRAASPEARVLNGGIYRPHADNGANYLRDLLAIDGVRGAIDVLSLHTYADDDGTRLETGIRRARALLPDRPVWVTETSVSSDGGEDRQARMLVAVVARAAAAGAERVFWHSLADPPEQARRAGPGREHPTFSLFRTLPGAPGDAPSLEPKPAAGVYQRLAALLAGDDLANATPDGDGAVRLKSGSLLVFSGSRPAPRGGVALLDGSEVAPGGTAEAPAWVK